MKETDDRVVLREQSDTTIEDMKQWYIQGVERRDQERKTEMENFAREKHDNLLEKLRQAALKGLKLINLEKDEYDYMKYMRQNHGKFHGLKFFTSDSTDGINIVSWD